MGAVVPLMLQALCSLPLSVCCREESDCSTCAQSSSSVVFCLSVSDREPTRERTLFSVSCMVLNNTSVLLTSIRTLSPFENNRIHGLSFLYVDYITL